MHFVRGEGTASVRYTHSQWHHIGVLGFVEFSEPMKLDSVCDEMDQWQAVKVETGLLQALVRFIPIWVFPNEFQYRQLDISKFLFPLNVIPFPLNVVYSPEQVSVACLSSQ